MITRREFFQQSIAISAIPLLPPLDFGEDEPLVSEIRCDPRVILLKGISSTGAQNSVESGNHLRIFAGTDHGLANVMDVYRRPAQNKLTRLVSFVIPAEKSILFKFLGPNIPSVDLQVETTLPNVKLSASVRKGKDESLLFSIRFPQVTGYISLTNTQDPKSWKLKGEGKGVVLLSGFSQPNKGDDVQKRPQPAPTLRVQRIPPTKKSQKESPKRQVISGIGTIKATSPSKPVGLECLFDGELVTRTRLFAANRKLINYPLDEIRVDVPVKQGIAIQFVLMENDSVEGPWTRFERIPCGKKVLEMADEAGNRELFFRRFVRSRFWSDVRNRYLQRGSNELGLNSNGLLKEFSPCYHAQNACKATPVTTVHLSDSTMSISTLP